MPLRRTRSLASATASATATGSSSGGSGMGQKQWSTLAMVAPPLPRAHFSRRKQGYHSRYHNHHHNHHNHQQQQQQQPAHSSSYKASSREVHVKAFSDLQTAATRLPHPDVLYGAMIPEPDYSDDEREQQQQQPCLTSLVARNNQANSNDSNNKEEKSHPGQGRLDERGLIMPKKLVNPCLESTDKKNLHRELMFNQKMGVSVLNQKTELQKAMEKHNDKKVLKEQEKEKQASMTPFQKALDERAQKIEQMEKAENKGTENEKAPSCEFQKIHAKVRAKMEVQ